MKIRHVPQVSFYSNADELIARGYNGVQISFLQEESKVMLHGRNEGKIRWSRKYSIIQRNYSALR